MTYQELVDTGITFRERTEPEQALACFGQSFILEPDSAAAFNNYGNTLREMGHPLRAIPFLQHACLLDPSMSTAQFNLSVAILLSGNLSWGMKQYESRWGFEHLQGLLPAFEQPKWYGENLTDKTILIIGEQGHGDVLHFSRFVADLKKYNPKKICFHTGADMIELFQSSQYFADIEISNYPDKLPEFDTWSMLMSLPIGLRTEYNTLNSPTQYIEAPARSVAEWKQRLGAKTQKRIGIGWSGRRDTWINRHKAVKFECIAQLISQNPNYEWINLQADATQDENAILTSLGVAQYPNTIRDWSDTAGLVANLDLVIGVDTSISHLAGAMGKQLWVMLPQYALDWRWLLDRGDSPWYPSAKLFRQPVRGDWNSVINKITHFLSQ
jgi:ADP-heptose:LPS heptosyltransferase